MVSGKSLKRIKFFCISCKRKIKNEPNNVYVRGELSTRLDNLENKLNKMSSEIKSLNDSLKDDDELQILLNNLEEIHQQIITDITTKKAVQLLTEGKEETKEEKNNTEKDIKDYFGGDHDGKGKRKKIKIKSKRKKVREKKVRDQHSNFLSSLLVIMFGY